MAEYIDRGAFIEWLKRIRLIDLSDGRGLCRVIMEDDFKKAIKKMPKGIIADVAPVVRCKDCKHFKHYGKTSLLIDGEHIKAGWCYRRVRYNEEYRMPPDGFCSYGERKDDADG